MTTTEFAGSANDALLIGSNATYATARGTYSGTVGDRLIVGQKLDAGVFSVYRPFTYFNTSTIGADATIVSATIKFYLRDNNSTTDFDVQIVKISNDGISANDSGFDAILAGDADDSILVNTASSGAGYNTSGALDITHINKTGNTWYALRSSRDASNTEPSGREDIEFQSVWGNSPILTVTYTTGGLLRIANFNGNMQNLSGGIHG